MIATNEPDEASKVAQRVTRDAAHRGRADGTAQIGDDPVERRVLHHQGRGNGGPEFTRHRGIALVVQERVSGGRDGHD